MDHLKDLNLKDIGIGAGVALGAVCLFAIVCRSIMVSVCVASWVNSASTWLPALFDCRQYAVVFVR